MPSSTLTVRVDSKIKRRLERLAKSTDRSRSDLAAKAIAEYLTVNDWQVAGIKRALASADRGEGSSQREIEEWVASWGGNGRRPAARRMSK
ncbi:MAG: CopG family ribbon-helix-helix protein [Rhodospirillaceae bacterium]|nr:CopG family ribbon-helix-helix protein [Rhodospirillaceae bacterium]